MYKREVGAAANAEMQDVRMEKAGRTPRGGRPVPTRGSWRLTRFLSREWAEPRLFPQVMDSPCRSSSTALLTGVVLASGDAQSSVYSGRWDPRK